MRATTRKVVNFFEEKSAPPDKMLATPMILMGLFDVTDGRTDEQYIT